MSIWQFNAAVHGWNEAQGADDKKLTPQEKDDLWTWLDTKPDTVRRPLLN